MKETPIVTGRKETATKTAGMAERRTETRYLSTASKVAGQDVTELPLAGMELALADEKLTRELSGYYTRIETRNVLLTGKGALGLYKDYLVTSPP